MPQPDSDAQDLGGARLQPLLHPQARRARPAAPEKSVLAERGAGAVRTGAPGKPRGEGDRDRAWPRSRLSQPHHPEIRRRRADHPQTAGLGPAAIPARPDGQGPPGLRQTRAQFAGRCRGNARRAAARRRPAPDRGDDRDRAAARRLQRPPPPAILRDPRPGDMGWVVQSHGELYAREYGFDSSFEALVAEIAAKFLASFDASRERCWIADIDGTQVGSVFLVRHSDDVAKLRLLLVDPAGRGQGLGRRLVGECISFRPPCGYRKITLWTQSILLVAARDLSGCRLRAGRHGAAPQLRPEPDRRDLGAQAVTLLSVIPGRVEDANYDVQLHIGESRDSGSGPSDHPGMTGRVIATDSNFKQPGRKTFFGSSLRANGSRECAPDDRLREAIHRPARKEWIASSLRSSQ